MRENLRESTGTPKRSSRRVAYSDRYIPSRSGTDIHANFTLLNENRKSDAAVSEEPRSKSSDSDASYSFLLKSELFGDSQGQASPHRTSKPLSDRSSWKHEQSTSGNVFKFQSETVTSPAVESQKALLRVQTPMQRAKRKISKVPYKVLCAPDLQNDFYLNLVDWSSTNALAVGLEDGVYLWSACTSKVTKIQDSHTFLNDIASVGWSPRGKELAVGITNGDVLIYDAATLKLVRRLGGHASRVGCVAWNSSLLSSGSRDGNILNRDLRCPEDYVSKLSGHEQEICGLKWSPHENELASGGNDNKLLVWDTNKTTPCFEFNLHIAAVKAIAWSPHQRGLLASGGGTADRTIRFWNTLKGNQINCIEAGSQVCNLAWSANVNELVSTHGYSQNQIIVWRYPKLSKVVMLTGHTTRVLYLSVSPSGESIVTGAGDETLRFWNIFPGVSSGVSSYENPSLLSPNRLSIR
ncbi:hypothetical protein NDN08_001427 [Rhodosorus marinus]|uniref:CDC20/Fizzy WD40 domain-containing protein n=1 Tax=Rhodosorus marinus TaxID=101924 RepID=A0AAV8UUY0_9RHOD|nr:hypothetical protein NDN08_001427 [Rhodosorus marinus]